MSMHIFQQVKIPREFCSTACNIGRHEQGEKTLPWPPGKLGIEPGADGVQRKTTDRVWIT